MVCENTELIDMRMAREREREQELGVLIRMQNFSTTVAVRCSSEVARTEERHRWLSSLVICRCSSFALEFEM